MLDHEEQFLFREEIHPPATAASRDSGMLDNAVEDLLAAGHDHPHFDSDVFTLERSLQVMLGAAPARPLSDSSPSTGRVFDQLGRDGLPSEVHERLVRGVPVLGLAIDNALNFLNNPDGIQGHNFATQVAHIDARQRTLLQGRLTLVRYNNEPQFFLADADVLLNVAADMLELTRRSPRARDAHRRRARDPTARGRRPRASHAEGAHGEFGACPPSASSWPRPARTAARRRRASACWLRSAQRPAGWAS